MAGRIRTGVRAFYAAKCIYDAAKHGKPGSGHSVSRKRNVTGTYAERLRAMIGELETPAARDTVRMAVVFAESASVTTAEENAAFMTGLAQILSGLEGDAKSSRGRK